MDLADGSPVAGPGEAGRVAPRSGRGLEDRRDVLHGSTMCMGMRLGAS